MGQDKKTLYDNEAVVRDHVHHQDACNLTAPTFDPAKLFIECENARLQLGNSYQ